MQNDTLEHLTNTIDGYVRARTAADRRMYLRATLRGLVAMAEGMTRVLRRLVTALTMGDDERGG